MTGNKDSYLNLWRALIAMTNIDGVVTIQETDWIDQFLKNKLLSENDRAILRDDVENPKDPLEFIEKISDAPHLCQLHHLSNLVFNADDFDYKEQKYLLKIQSLVEKKIDTMGAMRSFEESKSKSEKLRKESKSEAKGLFLNMIEYFRDH